MLKPLLPFAAALDAARAAARAAALDADGAAAHDAVCLASIYTPCFHFAIRRGSAQSDLALIMIWRVAAVAGQLASI